MFHDKNGHTGVWMIDFAKTTNVGNKKLTHRLPWQPGNFEDGYLFGLDNMIRVCKML